MAVGWNFQFQYAEATNATQLESYPPIVSARSRDKREVISDRELAYSGVESLLNRLVFKNASHTRFGLAEEI